MAWRSRSPVGAILAIVVVLTASVLFFQSTFKSQPQGVSRLLDPTAQAGSAEVAQHYSPFENLEQMDQERLDSAQHTHRHRDVFFYRPLPGGGTGQVGPARSADSPLSRPRAI